MTIDRPYDGVDALVNETVPPVKLLPLLSDEEMQNRPKPKQTIEGMLLQASTAALVGPPGAGKGLMAVDACYRLANDMEYYGGRAVMSGQCVYIALERAAGIGARIRAWKHYHGRPDPAPVSYLVNKVSLFDPAGARSVVETLKQLDVPIRLVILDTAAKAILPGDENSTRDMGQFMENQQRIAESGPTVLSLHHMNAGGTRERGNTAFRGDVDTLMLVSGSHGSNRIEIECAKINDLPEFEPFGLLIEPVPEAESAVVISDAPGSTAKLTESGRKLLRDLYTLCLATETASQGALSDISGLKTGSLYSTLAPLLMNGYVAKVGKGRTTRYMLTESGKYAVSPDSRFQEST